MIMFFENVDYEFHGNFKLILKTKFKLKLKVKIKPELELKLKLKFKLKPIERLKLKFKLKLKLKFKFKLNLKFKLKLKSKLKLRFELKLKFKLKRKVKIKLKIFAIIENGIPCQVKGVHHRLFSRRLPRTKKAKNRLLFTAFCDDFAQGLRPNLRMLNFGHRQFGTL
ncbi:unnamed protein product [Nesidiocoris tenuis]|uniref:Uncharacterized protein n=1 Tax=Nesidiocoris tenuis TaxID=355587 RepID=A0A6H5HSP0_9HEMI|nr:unnamed protein product [Nesidiocoris tenuis]